MSLSEEKLRVVQNGKLSELALDHFKAVVDQSKQEVVIRMMNSYRSDDVDYNVLIGGTAELVALDNIILKLERALKNSRKIDETIKI